MTPSEWFNQSRQWAHTPQGRIAYWENGSGIPALFIHGFPLNAFQWHAAFNEFQDIRRCIAPDLLGLGHTQPTPGQPLDFAAQADMVLAFADALGLETFDLIGNDSGCAIAQLVAVCAPDRVNTLVLTNGDAHDNWPPEAFIQSYEGAKAGILGNNLEILLNAPDDARAALTLAMQHPEHLTDELLHIFLQPLTSSPEKKALTNGYIAAMDNSITTGIENQLRQLTVPTLIVWGDDDVYFPVEWAHWLADTIPGAKQVRTVPSGRLFFPLERADEFHSVLREFWS